MKKKIVVANWKMNPETAGEARKIFLGVKKFSGRGKNPQVILCPPNLYLLEAKKYAKFIGAQDVFSEIRGAHTGETSAKMLRGNGVSHVILGHSERRAEGDTDEVVNRKVNVALSEKLKVILCVGEKERDFEGKYLEIIAHQIKNSLRRVGRSSMKDLIIAYEPVFTIGNKNFEAMEPHDVHQMVILIRKHLISHFADRAASRIPILYGGSVSFENAGEIIKVGAVDGFLVGRQSLNPEQFGKLVKAVSKA